jgi:hypothetical protein
MHAGNYRVPGQRAARDSQRTRARTRLQETIPSHFWSSLAGKSTALRGNHGLCLCSLGMPFPGPCCQTCGATFPALCLVPVPCACVHWVPITACGLAVSFTGVGPCAPLANCPSFCLPPFSSIVALPLLLHAPPCPPPLLLVALFAQWFPCKAVCSFLLFVAKHCVGCSGAAVHPMSTTPFSSSISRSSMGPPWFAVALWPFRHCCTLHSLG